MPRWRSPVARASYFGRREAPGAAPMSRAVRLALVTFAGLVAAAVTATISSKGSLVDLVVLGAALVVVGVVDQIDW